MRATAAAAHTHVPTDGIELEASTATGTYVQSDGQVNVEFFIDPDWTTPQFFFKGTNDGETMKNTYPAVEAATKLRLSISSGDAWAFWRIKFGGVTILEQQDGSVRPEYTAGSRFWIDGDNTDGVSASIEIDIPGAFSFNLVQCASNSTVGIPLSLSTSSPPSPRASLDAWASPSCMYTHAWSLCDPLSIRITLVRCF
jgi:hypothetical protein